MHGHKMEKYKYHASSVEVQVNQEKVPTSMSQFFNKVIMSDNMPQDIKGFAHMMAADKFVFVFKKLFYFVVKSSTEKGASEY